MREGELDDVKVTTTTRVEVPVETHGLAHVIGALELLRSSGVPETAEVSLEFQRSGTRGVVASWVMPPAEREPRSTDWGTASSPPQSPAPIDARSGGEG